MATDFSIRGLYVLIFNRRKSNLRLAVHMAIGAFFTMGAAFCYNNHRVPPLLVICLLLLGGTFMAFAARQAAIHYNKNEWANPWWWIVWLAYCVLGGTDMYFEYGTSPKLHLRLYAHTTDAPDINLNFTNSFLFPETTKDGFKFPKNLPFLVVNVASTLPEAVLKFGVLNDSSNRFSSSEFEIEKPEIDVWIVTP